LTINYISDYSAKRNILRDIQLRYGATSNFSGVSESVSIIKVCQKSPINQKIKFIFNIHIHVLMFSTKSKVSVILILFLLSINSEHDIWL